MAYSNSNTKVVPEAREALDKFAENDYKDTDLFNNNIDSSSGRKDYISNFRTRLDTDDVFSQDVDKIRKLYDKFLSDVTSQIKDTGILPSSGF